MCSVESSELGLKFITAQRKYFVISILSWFYINIFIFNFWGESANFLIQDI